MKRKRKESCPSPILDDSPKRTKVQAQRKFAQNSGVHSPIITPIRDLETADLPHTSVIPEPVELLPMKRPNTEDFLTFLCFRGTPILPPNLQFFNTASIVTDGQVHEIKGDSPKNGPIDITKCAGSSSEKPFIAFGVRKRADPIVISRQMERKRRHALALQALRRKYQEQKMAKIRALTISKLSEKTTNKTLVKTNTIQKTETVTKKNNTLHKTKVIATKHVKVTTQTLKTKVKPKMCLRSFRGKFVQKELPFRPRRPLPEADTIRKKVKNVVRTSRNSNKHDVETINKPNIAISPKKTLKRLVELKQPLKVSQKSRITRSESVGEVTRPPIVVAKTTIKRPQLKRRILLPAGIVSTIVKPKLRSTTMKKTVISRKKAQQRLRANRGSRSIEPLPHVKESATGKHLVDQLKKEVIKKTSQDKPAAKKTISEAKKVTPQETPEVSRRFTRKDSEMANKNSQGDKNDTKREITKNLELKKETKIAESGSKKTIKKNLNLKREFNLKSSTKDIKKNVALQKTSDTVLEKSESGQKVTRDVKTMEMTVNKIVTRKSESNEKNKDKKNSNPKATSKEETVSNDRTRKGSRSPSKPREEVSKKSDKPLENPKKASRTIKSEKESSTSLKGVKQVTTKESNLLKDMDAPKTTQSTEKLVKELPKKKVAISKNDAKEEVASKNNPGKPSAKVTDEDTKRITRDSASKKPPKEAPSAIKSPKDDYAAKKAKEHPRRESPPKKVDQEFSKKIQELIDNALKEAEDVSEESSSSNTVQKEEILITKHEDELKTNVNTQHSLESKDFDNNKHVKDSEKPLEKSQNEEITKNPDAEKEENEKVKTKVIIKEKETAGEVLAKNSDKELAQINEKIEEPLSSRKAIKEVETPPECSSKKPEKDKNVGESASKKPEKKTTKEVEKDKTIAEAKPEKKTAKEIEKDKPVAEAKPEKKTAKEVEKDKTVAEAKPEKITAKEVGKDKTIAEAKPEKKTTKEVEKDKTVAEASIKKPEKKATKEVEKDKIVPESLTKKVEKKTTKDVEKDKHIQELTSKKTTKEETTTKKIAKQESLSKKPSKETVSSKKEDNPKRKGATKKEDSEQVAPIPSTRPSRKTKEAAAIYMEILSHKLVNESTIDDDNGSIDSFPELPNVKKTEQREIELKAQAKTSKEECKTTKNPLINENMEEKKPKKQAKIEENISNDNSKPPEQSQVKDTQKKLCETNSDLLKSPASDKSSKIKPAKDGNPKDTSKTPVESSVTTKTSLGKRKSNPITIASDDDSDNEVLQAKIRKSEAQKSLQLEQSSAKKVSVEESLPATPPVEEVITTRRQTRRCTQTTKDSDSDSSDESFHIDVRVPRKKKITRSRNRIAPAPAVSMLEKNVDIILEAARVLEAEKALPIEVVAVSVDKPIQNFPPAVLVEDKPPKVLSKPPKDPKKVEIPPKGNQTDSDESTTSDINLKSLQVKQRNKKLSKTKSSKSSAKSAPSFSDSDEEPLAKLTTKSISVNESEELKKKLDKPKSAPRKTADKVLVEVAVMEPKPKRECTKRPSNYLPMLSSSDEDDEPYFHGFNTSKEELNKPKVFVQALAPSLDLLSKDIGRKGKVNMSNEQIEQWLKDSALAGSSVAKENDAMLKFGEKIPAEVPKAEPILPAIVPELKPLESEKVTVKEVEPQPSSSKAIIPDDKPKAEIKSPLPDICRKWIFKKDKKELLPNKNAFSPENECSVYAFGEDNEDVVSTPFRRPSRRPSSTATSRSEDELSKNEDSSKQGDQAASRIIPVNLSQFRKPNPSDSEDSRCFNIPQNPTKPAKAAKCDTMVPPSSYHSKRQTKPSMDRFPEPFDDYKYKIPSSPSASSGSSAKLYKKGSQKPKGKVWESINPVYVSDFPKPTDPAKLVEAPVFHPTEQDFQDPLEYIERIRHKAEQFGICKIVPPSTFKPECKVSDDMRFTAYNQYVHKMLHRWGPNFKEFIAIRKYLATQSIFLKTPPLIGGMEIDLPRLYQTVQSLGGLKEVIEKKKWSKVSDHMKIPKSAQDRVTKLDDIYCKYLLPYDTLSPAEREKLFDEVETYWAKKESKNLQERADPKPGSKLEESSEQDFYDSDDNETEECTLKGKNMALSAFYRIARNTMSMYFKVAEPTALEVEQEFWRYVTQKQNHICVHSASIDCGTWGYGFAVSKNSPFARHAWNLKILSNNSGSVLRSLGPVMGVTIPTLHVGMVFSACCWYRDPHGLPWVEYLHTGGNKIWYGIPSSSCEVFHAAIQKLAPNYCRDKELWLPSDTAMVPPGMLIDHNVSLCRTIQEPGQFIVVFPKVFTSSICTGYVVSESVYFASLHWLKTARNLFNDLKNSCEPSMFSLDKLLVSISNDNRSSAEVLRVIIPFMDELCSNEKQYRLQLRNFGKVEEEKITNTEPPTKKKKIQSVDGDFECEICRTNLFISMVIDTQDDLIYCLEDAVKLLEKNPKMVERLKLKYSLDEAELDNIPTRLNSMIEAKLQKKQPPSKYVVPTMLK